MGVGHKVTREWRPTAVERGTWGPQRLVRVGSGLVRGFSGGRSGRTSSGTWIWGFSKGVLSESWGKTPAPRVWRTLPPALYPLTEALSWGATEDRGIVMKLLSHCAIWRDPRRERPRDRLALRARWGWSLALWRWEGHSWGLAGWLGGPVMAGMVAGEGQVHLGAQCILSGKRKTWRRWMALCARRDRQLAPRWMASCSRCPAGWLADSASGMTASSAGRWGGRDGGWHVPRGRWEARLGWDAPGALGREWAGGECGTSVSVGSTCFPIQNLRLRAGRDSGATQSNLALCSEPPFPWTGYYPTPISKPQDKRVTTHKATVPL